MVNIINKIFGASKNKNVILNHYKERLAQQDLENEKILKNNKKIMLIATNQQVEIEKLKLEVVKLNKENLAFEKALNYLNVEIKKIPVVKEMHQIQVVDYNDAYTMPFTVNFIKFKCRDFQIMPYVEEIETLIKLTDPYYIMTNIEREVRNG